MRDVWNNIQEARDFLAKNVEMPKIAVTLGSGLSELLTEIETEIEIPYSKIPHMKQTTVEGHAGKLVIGNLRGTRVACMQGRLHYYEGYSMGEVVFPFRVLALSGVECFVLTNASGGMRSDMKPLDLMLISDHINLMGGNPLIGANISDLGERFPDMTYLYDRELREVVRSVAKKHQIPLKEGVYVALHGPSFETPAEIRMYRTLGGDVVGMSTVPEAVALGQMRKKIVGISFISNLASGVIDQPLDHTEVLENAKRGYGTFSTLVAESIREIGKRL